MTAQLIKEVFEATAGIDPWLCRHHYNWTQSFLNNKNSTTMEFGLNQINRDTPEGKLLFAAIVHLTTHHFRDKTPEQVIGILWDIHKKTEEANSRDQKNWEGHMKSCTTATHFDELIKQAVNHDAQIVQGRLKDLKTAGDVVIDLATPSMNPDDFTTLASLLVKLYRHYSKV